MFNLCQTVHIHQHHYHQVVVLPRKSKANHRPHSQQINKLGASVFFNKNIPSSKYSSETYTSVENDRQRSRKGIQVVSKEPNLPNFPARHSFTPHGNYSRQSQLRKSWFQQACSSPTPSLSRPPKLKDIRANHRQKNPIQSLSEIEKCINSKQKCINLKQNLQMSSPIKPVQIATAVQDLTHSSPHCLRPTQISISPPKHYESVEFASPDRRRGDGLVKRSFHQQVEEGLSNLRQYYAMKGSSIQERMKLDLKLDDTKIQSSSYSPTKNSIKLGKTQRQLFDAISISSHDSENLNDEINIEQSILINRKIDTFAPITPVRKIGTGQMCLAVEKDINLVVCLKTFGEKEEQSYLEQSHLHQITEKNSSDLLSLYQVLIQENQDSKKIIFVREPFQAFFDQWIANNKTKLQQGDNAKRMISCIEETTERVIVQFNKLNYCLVELLALQDFVVVNSNIKLHLLTKFKHQSDCCNIKTISILESQQHLKYGLLQKIGLQL